MILKLQERGTISRWSVRYNYTMAANTCWIPAAAREHVFEKIFSTSVKTASTFPVSFVLELVQQRYMTLHRRLEEQFHP